MLPAQVEICEVGPRDGFQFEDKLIPTEMKVRAIQQVIDAGVRRVQVTSFVHPKWVPQMADAEDVVRALPQRDDVIYTGLALNIRGVERAAASGLKYVDISIATNEQHSRDNTKMSVDDAIRQADEMLDLAASKGLEAQLGLQTVFGYAAPADSDMDRILELIRRYAAAGVESISLADSTGMANPVMIRERVRAAQDVAGDVPLVLHLHDTRGLGMANVFAAAEEGITRFDTSFGGLGGCPFIPGATGNIATEDTAYLLESVGIETGIDFSALARVSLEVERFLDKPLPGRVVGLMRRGAEISMGK